jgi:hypothetical protein
MTNGGLRWPDGYSDEERYLGEQAWNLHLAFTEVAGRDPSAYSTSETTSDQIAEYCTHREAELALDLILASASTSLPATAVAHAERVTARMAPHAATEEVAAYVAGWLRWHLGCDWDPPRWM